MKLRLKKFLDFWVGGGTLILLYFPVRWVGAILKREHHLDQVEHICLVKLLGGGSLFMILPTAEALQKKFPRLKLSLVCSPAIKAFAETLGIFQEIKVIDDRLLPKLLSSGFDILWWLFKNIDTTIDLEVHSRLTTVLTTVSCIKNRIGLVDQNSLWRRRIYTHAIYVNVRRSFYDSYEAIGALFDIKKIDLAASQKQAFENYSAVEIPFELPAGKTIITLGVGCSDLAYERMLPPELWSKLLKRIQSDVPNAYFVFLGGKADIGVVQEIATFDPTIYDSAMNLCGKLLLKESLAYLAHSHFFIGIDSALIHMARFLKIPTVSFWGPTSPEGLLRPLQVRELRIYSSIYCSPCVHISEFPPCQRQNICMHHQNRFGEVLQFLKESAPLPSMPQTVSKFVWVYDPDNQHPRRMTFDAILG